MGLGSKWKRWIGTFLYLATARFMRRLISIISMLLLNPSKYTVSLVSLFAQWLADKCHIELVRTAKRAGSILPRAYRKNAFFIGKIIQK